MSEQINIVRGRNNVGKSVYPKKQKSSGNKKIPKKILVLDTNILIEDPECIFKFENNDIIIPISVIEELDGLKSKLFTARKASNVLDKLEVGSSPKKLLNGGKIWIDTESGKKEVLDFNSTKNDDRIIACAKYLRDNRDERKYSKVVLISNDKNVRVKARAFKISVERYLNERVSIGHDTSLKKIILNQEQLTNLGVYDNNKGDIQITKEISSFIKKNDIMPNDGMIFCLEKAKNMQLTVVYKYGKLVKVNTLNKRVYENAYVSPYVPEYYKDEISFNPNMEVLIENLLDPNITLVSIYGQAGTGKTRAAVGAALDLVYNKKTKYEKIIITKAIVPIGDDLGYLPGDKNDKMKEWILPIRTQVNDILGGTGHIQNSPSEYQENNPYQILLETDIIEVEPTTYIRGASFKNCIVIVDEPQNISQQNGKTWFTRMGENTKLILAGDIDQIDAKYLDRDNNALSVIMEKTRGQIWAAKVPMEYGVRSAMSDWAASNL